MAFVRQAAKNKSVFRRASSIPKLVTFKILIYIVIEYLMKKKDISSYSKEEISVFVCLLVCLFFTCYETMKFTINIPSHEL